MALSDDTLWASWFRGRISEVGVESTAAELMEMLAARSLPPRPCELCGGIQYHLPGCPFDQ